MYVEHCKMSIGVPDQSVLEMSYDRNTGTHSDVQFTSFFTIDSEECVISLYTFSQRSSYGLTVSYQGTSEVIMN